MILMFFFKQKTSYERRSSDWSADVCSSDLARIMPMAAAFLPRRVASMNPNPEKQRKTPMAKKSAINKNERRRKLAKKYAPKYARPEERSVGKECVRQCRFRRSPYP